MKILATEQIREADRYTIKNEPIASIDLMERAANAFVQQLEKDFPDRSIPKIIICGSGNNGGDGLAITRILLSRGHKKVTAFLLPAQQYSADNLQNQERLRKRYKRHLHTINDTSFLEAQDANCILIDAIFGTGLNKPVKAGSLAHQLIELITQKKFRQVVSVDIPSGLFAGEKQRGIAVAAHKTYTFQFPKLSFLVPENGIYVQDFTVLDIGLHPAYIQKAKTPYTFTNLETVRPLWKPRSKFAHKGTYGHAGIAAGSFGKMGAAVLCAKACLRSGAGLVSVHIPACGYEILQSAFPEAMCSVDTELHFLSAIPFEETNYDAVGIGPGIGSNKATIKALQNFLLQSKKPLVLDADALNILSKRKELLKHIPRNSILTPHPKEFERLAGRSANTWERWKKQREFSITHKVIVVLKGAHTSISDSKGNLYFNSSGNPGMASAGSGDVLTGILTALSAQDYEPLNTALLGVFIHGMAGDLALQEQSRESLIASDIIAHLGEAFKTLSV